MSKDKEEKPTEVQNLAGNEVSFMMPSTEELGSLQTMDEKFNLNVKYRTQEDWYAFKDKPVRAFFMGMKDVPNDKGEVVSCGVFVAEKEIFICGQMIIIDAVRQLPARTPVQITFLGKKNNKSSDGATNLFEVITLQ